MIDLHIHTNHSDGSDDVISILKKAEAKKLKVISITDHDTCSAYQELEQLNVREFFNGNIIIGVELKTHINGYKIELLGLNVDYKYINNEVNKYYLPQKEKRKIEKERLLKICNDLGVKLDTVFNDEYNPYEEYAGSYIYKHIIKHEENKRFFKNRQFPECFYNFYREHLSNPDSVFYVDLLDIIPDINTIIKLIKESGGLVFIPHPFIYKENSMNILKSLINNYKIDGIECYYHNHTDEEIAFLVNLCQKNNLLVSGGSDYHGISRPNVKLGVIQKNKSIPFEIIQNWYDKNKILFPK